jgi:hypothetical protein
LWEKEQSNKVRQRIAAAAVCAVTQWRQESTDGQFGSKARAIRQEYDAQGRLISISAFSHDTVSESAVYSYSPAGDMVSDIDLNSQGGIVETNVFAYDRQGRVLSGINFDSTGGAEGRFAVQHFRSRGKIEYTSYGKGDSVEYTILYAYAKDYDSSDYSSAVKLSRGGDTTIVVTKDVDSHGRMVMKRVDDRVAKKTFSFVYVYDQNNLLVEVSKRFSDSSVETRSRSAYDTEGMCKETVTMNGRGEIIRKIANEYEYIRAITGNKVRD